ncbi:hypothetical protein COCNU_02G007470 [Cocos nucifera]|uniref:PWWP domain-containing protein n=1 Tax=Cocos nucifera TaxID=13894 RepID=A0A8K0HZL9_COCNU|nr:hypothetical protein COCNU_02G007470 [Cocos nucifera]
MVKQGCRAEAMAQGRSSEKEGAGMGPHEDNEKKDGFSILDMVWGKVRSHPWWLGQIFDPSDASEMALEHEKKDHFLVAYFGDKTFAWREHVAPLLTVSLIASSFQPERFLEYILALAHFLNGESDSLELLIAKARLRSFYHSKGYTELPVFVVGGGLENDVETTLDGKRKSDYDVADLSILVSSYSISERGKRGRGRSPKQKIILEDGRKQKSLSELIKEKHVPHHGDSGRSGSGARAIFTFIR